MASKSRFVPIRINTTDNSRENKIMKNQHNTTNCQLTNIIITKNNNIGEILIKSAEFRLFNHDKTERLFQCALAINGDTVKITLAASFVESDIATLREVKEVLQAMNFKIVEFERTLNGDVKIIKL